MKRSIDADTREAYSAQACRSDRITARDEKIGTAPEMYYKCKCGIPCMFEKGSRIVEAVCKMLNGICEETFAS